jgi:FkbM family methyltransferase
VRRISLYLGRVLCRYRGCWIVDRIEQFTLQFHRGLNNVDFDQVRNGECRVLQILKKYNVDVVFDVGANVGDWSKFASEQYQSASIYAFEVLPSTFEILQRNYNDSESIKCYNVGLSDSEGEVLIHHGSDSVVASGCKLEGMAFHDSYYDSATVCATTTGALFLDREGLDSIDFMKIDVEGMDLKVIRGFGARIRDVRVIQFEYGIFNIGSHDLLYDFCTYLSVHGFKVGKVFPKTVQFFDYHFDLENLHGSNYLAVRNDQVELMEALSSD